MGAFDTAITPAAATPANTSNATLFIAAGDSSVLVNAANIGVAQLLVRVGITPSGGSVFWILFDVAIPAGDALANAVGPLFLQSGDAVTVRTDTANDAVFSVTGVRTS